MISFEKLQKQDLAIFQLWLEKDHVKTYWQETNDTKELENKFINQLPRKKNKGKVRAEKCRPEGVKR